MINILHAVDLHELEERRGVQKDALRLHMPIPPISFLTLDLFENDGGKIGKHALHYKDLTHTYNRNAYNMLTTQHCFLQSTYGEGYGAGKMGNTATDATVKSTANYAHVVSIISNTSNAAAADVTRGIVIGTGVGGENFEGYILGTKILHGITAGKMSYQAMPAVVTSYNAVTKTLSNVLERCFNNDSGGTILVSEVGLYVYMTLSGSTNNAMLWRELLAEDYHVPTANILRVRYQVDSVYPA